MTLNEPPSASNNNEDGSNNRDIDDYCVVEVDNHELSLSEQVALQIALIEDNEEKRPPSTRNWGRSVSTYATNPHINSLIQDVQHLLQPQNAPPFRVGDQVYQFQWPLIRLYEIVLEVVKASRQEDLWLVMVASATSRWKQAVEDPLTAKKRKFLRKNKVTVSRESQQRNHKSALHLVNYLGDPIPSSCNNEEWKFHITQTPIISDSPQVSLERIKFLMHLDPATIKVSPRLRLLFKDSECAAVWCKSGSWSKLNPPVGSRVAMSAGATAAVVGSLPIRVLAAKAATEVLPLAAAAPKVVPLLALAVTVPVGVTVGAKILWKQATEFWNQEFANFFSTETLTVV